MQKKIIALLSFSSQLVEYFFLYNILVIQHAFFKMI